MHPSTFARQTPHTPAVVMVGSGETLSYGALEAASNQVAHLLRGLGLGGGDTVALLMDNSPAYFALTWGAQRAGLYFVCISTKLTAGEVAYILSDCAAKVLFVSPTLADVAPPPGQVDGLRQFAVGGDVAGLERYEAAVAGQPQTPIADETAGSDMLYSSGTTGRPKGVKLPLSGQPIDAPNPLLMLTKALYGLGPDSRYLSPAPLYHAAPLRWCMAVHRLGGTTYIMERFEPEAYLQAVQDHEITASQLVPTMFVRMLKLPEAVRARYTVASLKMAVHAAAPCPVPIKEQMMAWWGPVIHEYYAGTEGNGFCAIGPQEWLQKKGSVGRAVLGTIRIVGEDGQEVPIGQEGTIFFEGGPEFSYHNAPDKTADSRNAKGWSTLGDVGYIDADGYLFLTDRKAFMIITGGVNVYPQEIENLLVTHPKVADVAVFGVPDPDFGEAVKAVVQPLDMADAGEALAEDLMALCREQLSPVKRPKSIDFRAELPRHATGKLYKRLLRDEYWAGRTSKLV